MFEGSKTMRVLDGQAVPTLCLPNDATIAATPARNPMAAPNTVSCIIMLNTDQPQDRYDKIGLIKWNLSDTDISLSTLKEMLDKNPCFDLMTQLLLTRNAFGLTNIVEIMGRSYRVNKKLG